MAFPPATLYAELGKAYPDNGTVFRQWINGEFSARKIRTEGGE